MRKELHIIENDVKGVSFQGYLVDSAGQVERIKKILAQRMTNERTVAAIRKVVQSPEASTSGDSLEGTDGSAAQSNPKGADNE